MLGAWPCGTIVLLGELLGAESISQVYAFLHTFLLKNRTSTENICTYVMLHCNEVTVCVMKYGSIAGYVCYDDGCHLKKYATNPVRHNQTETAIRIATSKIVIDKFHFKGHTDAWCKEHCDPNKCKDLNEVCIV